MYNIVNCLHNIYDIKVKYGIEMPEIKREDKTNTQMSLSLCMYTQ